MMKQFILTKAQIKIIRVLLSKMDLTEDKDNFVMQYTNNRTTHISEMTKKEAFELIRDLKKIEGAPKDINSRISVNESEQRMRRHIIAMAHNMNWELEDGRVDMAKVNNWVLRYGHLNGGGLVLNDYHSPDLEKLVTQFQKVYQHYLKYVAKKG